MSTATLTKTTDFKVRDIALADWGRKEISIAEKEMPGLMAIREKYAPDKPLAGVRITGSLHMTIQTAVLIETLVRTRRHSALGELQHLLDAGSRRRGHRQSRACRSSPGRAKRSRNTGIAHGRRSSMAEGKGPQLVVDDGGDVTLLLHKGYELEEGDDWVNTPSESHEEKVIKDLLKKIHCGESRSSFHEIVKEWRGVSEETTTGVHRLYKLQEQGKLLVPAFNVNDSVTKSKFDNLYGCRHSLVDGIKRAIDVMISGKVAVVCGYGDVGKGCAQSLRGPGRPCRHH